ncbi:MAG: hypothetical protein ABJL75_12025, partial [Nonlabens ulvanivorans]
YLKENSSSNSFPYQVTEMSKEEIINSTGNRDLFTTLNEATSIFSQKTTNNTPSYTILDSSAKVVTDDNNTFTSYTFNTINTLNDRVLRNIVVTDINGSFFTYLLSYIDNGDNTLTASYTLLSNDDSGLLKTTISVTNCEWIGYWKSEAVDDCDCYMEIWTVEEFCTTTTYQIPFTFLDSNPNSGGGGSSDGSSNSTWGTGTPVMGGTTGNGGGFLTQPFIDLNKIKLNEQTSQQSVRNEIIRMKGELNSSNKEQGSTFIRIGNTLFIGAPLPSTATGFDFTNFPNPSDPNTEGFIHMHHNTENSDGKSIMPVPSFADFSNFSRLYKRMSENFPTSSNNEDIFMITVTNGSIFAFKIGNTSDAISFANFMNQPLIGSQLAEVPKSFLPENGIPKISHYFDYKQYQQVLTASENQFNSSMTDVEKTALITSKYLNFINRIIKGLKPGIDVYQSDTTDDSGNKIWTKLN